MGRGASKMIRIDITDTYDPRVTGRDAQKGTLFRYIPAAGSPELLLKEDDGFSTNWASFGTALPITVAQAGSVADVNIAVAPANLDGVVGVVGDLWLLKDQAAPAENGVYTFNGVGVPLTRAPAWDTAASFVPGKEVFVDAGTVNDDTLWANADAVVVLGVTPIQFVRIGASIVTGDPNTIAYFDGAGVIDSNTSAKFDGTTNSMAIGLEATGGTVTSAGSAAQSHGVANTLGVIAANGTGAKAFGSATDQAQIDAAQTGSLAHGYTENLNSLIVASAEGSHAYGRSTGGSEVRADANGSFSHGNAETGSIIRSVDLGAHAAGYATGGAIISAAGTGAHSHGYALNAGDISTTDNGGHAHGVADAGSVAASAYGAEASGFAETIGSTIAASAFGAKASGYATNGGSILAQDPGAFAFGQSDNSSFVRSLSQGSLAHGSADNSGIIQGTGFGTSASGFCDGVGSEITASGEGAYATGRAEGGGTIKATGIASSAFGFVLAGQAILASGTGSYAHGSQNITASGSGSYAHGEGVINAAGTGSFAGGDGTAIGSILVNGHGSIGHGSAIDLSAQYAGAFGHGLNNSSFSSVVIGRFNEPTAFTPDAWFATEPVFVIGNGTGVGAEANAYRIDKDGKQTSTAAMRNTAIRAAVNPDTLSERTDNTLMVDTSVGAVAYVVNMPPGENGLEYYIKDIGYNASVNNITFSPNGGDIMEAGSNITTDAGSRHFKFFSGTWWILP